MTSMFTMQLRLGIVWKSKFFIKIQETNIRAETLVTLKNTV